MKNTFTYLHPIQGVIQHKIAQILHVDYISGGVTIEFIDDKGRKLGVSTNNPYVLRSEEGEPLTTESKYNRVSVTPDDDLIPHEGYFSAGRI